MNLLTVRELAAYLGLTEAGVRQVIRRKGIKRRGRGEFKASLYWPEDVLRHTGDHERLRKTA